jgi:hypothetical protein
MPGPLRRERAVAPRGRRLPPDERALAALLLIAGGDQLTAAERALCLATVQPGAPPRDWSERLRLAELAGRLLGERAP